MHTSKHVYWLIVLPFFIFSGCQKEIKQEKKIYPVMVGETIQKDVPIYIEAIGNVYSLATIDVRPQVSGVILESYVKQGQYVKKGDKLYQIDPRPFQASLDKAKAQLIKDQATLKINEETVERNKPIVKKDYLSKLTFDQYVSNVELIKGQILSDQADIDLAQLNLEWTSPISPIDGKISQFTIYPGNLVIAYDTNSFTTIQQIDPAEIRFTITQEDFIRVQKAMKEGVLRFEVYLPQAPDAPKEGNIYFIDNHIDLSTGTILLKGTIPNADEFLWPGEYITCRLQLRVHQNALLVPEEAVKISETGPFVFIYHPDTSTVEYRNVVKGEKIDHDILIEKGINIGDKVVVKGQSNLHSNDKVKLISAIEHPIIEK